MEKSGTETGVSIGVGGGVRWWRGPVLKLGCRWG